MGKLDGLANPQKQRQALGLGQMLLGTETMDGNSIHIFHRQVKVAACCNSSVQQPGDEWMLQSCQNLPLLTKSISEQAGGQREIDQFDSDLLLKLAIGAMRQIDGPHAAPAQQSIQHIRTDCLGLGSSLAAGFRRQLAGCRKALFNFAGFEQRGHLGSEFLVAVRSGLDQGVPFFAGSRKSLAEDGLDAHEAFCGLVHLSGNPVRGWYL